MYAKRPASLVVANLVPVKDDGFHGFENWVTACRSCNRQKWHFIPNEEAAPRLLWFRGREEAKVTTMGAKSRMRKPQLPNRRKVHAESPIG
jgi:5-methylcytosine-specific restriction endonuclease McrA